MLPPPADCPGTLVCYGTYRLLLSFAPPYSLTPLIHLADTLGTTVWQYTAESSGGGLVHGGVLAELSNSIFELNRAGNEGPAILSLGQLRSMSGVTFRDNYYYCEAGQFSSTTLVVRKQEGRSLIECV